MNNLTKYATGILGFTLVAITIFIYGCTSPDTTTGKLAYQQKDYEKAEEYLEKGLAVDKQDAEGWYMLGYSQMENGLRLDDYNRLNKAQQSLKNCLAISNNFSTYVFNFWVDKFNASAEYFKMGNQAQKDTALANNNYRQAIKYSYAATKILPDTIKAYRILGLTYYAMGNLDKATEIYEFIISKPSSNVDDLETYAELVYNKGLVLRNSEKFDDAIKVFEIVTNLKGLPKDNTYNEGSVLNIGISYYQMAIKVAAENGDYKPHLTKCISYLEPLGNSSKNKKILEQAYQYLEESYSALGDDAKKEEYAKKRESLK